MEELILFYFTNFKIYGLTGVTNLEYLSFKACASNLDSRLQALNKTIELRTIKERLNSSQSKIAVFIVSQFIYSNCC